MPGSRLRQGFDGLRSQSAEALAKAGKGPGIDDSLGWNRRPWPALGLRAGLEEKRHALAISNGTDRRDARDRRR
jgi:hypothetical protein